MLPKDIFQKHTHIGLDLDETLAESVLDVLRQLQGKGKMQFIREFDDIRYFDWTKFPDADISEEEFRDHCRNHHLTSVIPVGNSIDGVYQLFQTKKYLSIITARNEHDHRSDTERWLAKYFPEIHPSDIYFANHTAGADKKKSIICKEIGVSLMIEDGMHNATDLVENGITCLLLEKPWNRELEFEHPLLHRVKDWGEIIDVLNDE